MKKLAAVLLALLASAAAWADDGAIEAVGGAVRAMRAQPTVEMTAEYVHARVSPDRVRVDCVFWLHNRGPATTVTIGFPCASDGDVDGKASFPDFRSFVDGQPTTITVLPDSIRQIHHDYGSWYVKKVSFSPNETKCVRDEYTAEPGSDVDGHYWFEYILETGATWSGSIGHCDIVVSPEGISADSMTALPE